MASHTSPMKDFQRSSKLIWRRNVLQTLFGNVFENSPQAFTLHSTNDLDVSISWKLTGSASRVGSHHVVGINVGSLIQLPGQNTDENLNDGLSDGETLHGSSSVSSLTSTSKKRFSFRIGPTTGVQSAHLLTVKDENPLRVIMRGKSEMLNDFERGYFNIIYVFYTC